MLKGIRHISLLPAVAFFFVSVLAAGCDDDGGDAMQTTGTLSLGIEIDNTLYYPDGREVSGAEAFRPDVSGVSVYMKASFADYSHTWDSFSDFPEAQRYFAGQYMIAASYGYAAEGFESPSYRGSISADVVAGSHSEEVLTLGLVSSVSKVAFDDTFTSYFSSAKAFLHSDGGGYFEYAPAESRLLYLSPGNTSLTLLLTLPDGREAGFEALSVDGAKSACFYEYDVGLEFEENGTPVVVCSMGGVSGRVALTDAFLSAEPPVVTAQGWRPEDVIVLPEGDDPAAPVVASVSSASPLRHLYLSTNSPSLNGRGFPAQVDLADLSPEDASLMRGLGLSWSGSQTAMTVDFSRLLGNLTYLTVSEAMSTFGLIAVDSQGRVGPPTMLRVETSMVGVSVVASPPVTVGAAEAYIKVESSALDFASHVAVELRSVDGVWTPVAVTSVEPGGDGVFTVGFAIPDGSSPIEGRLVYCDEPRAGFTLPRVMPDFKFKIDPFATFVYIKVEAGDDATVRSVTERLYPYVDGKRGSVLMRDADRGLIVMSGLAPSTSYSLAATMMESPSAEDFTPSQTFATESVQSLPNMEFEERRDGPTYDGMASGGRYSQTVVAIFNWQNHQTFSLQEPKDWANTNAKTFNSASANHNTWYMQPSVYTVSDDIHSGNFAVCLRSVAFDVKGEKIPDYTQTGEPYLKYSPIVPRIASRAAGKLFLGSYGFDQATMTETYKDIVGWRSRPVSLNGYYKYVPSENDPSDAGVALVEVYGKVDGRECVIASGRTYLPVANSYMAFNVKLTYDLFGVKATGIRVMFASSHKMGTIAEETAGVRTVDDAKAAASVGSVLLLDHVNLSY